jgi:predicted permease
MAAPRDSRAYRALLRVLPAAFRIRNGTSMEHAFGVLLGSARERGRLAVLQLYASEAWDLLRTGVVLRVRTGKQKRQRHVTPGTPVWRGRPPMSALGDDVRNAFRSATRQRSFFLFGALTFALGVGATTAMFSALRSVVLNPLPYPAGERVVLIWRTMGAGSILPVAEPQQIEALRGESGIFEAFATYSGRGVALTGLGQPMQLESVQMGSGLAEIMGVRPVLGRLFSPEEMAGDGQRVLLVSHALWKSHFGGARDVLGRTLTLDGEPWTVIGVMPADVVRPDGRQQPVAFWQPLPAGARFQPIARLRDDITLETASARVDAVMQRTAERPGFGGTVRPLSGFRSAALAEPLRLLMGAVTLLLLIACVNVSNLLLHRAAARERETAVLAALGASRTRLLRQFLLESLLLALVGGALGVFLAAGAIRITTALRPDQLIALQAIRLDGGVLAFALIVSTLSGVVMGLLPALRAARADAGAALARAPREGRATSARFRWTLVGVEVALSFALLVGATLLIGSLREYATRDPGYAPDGLLNMSVTLPAWRYEQEPARRVTFDRMLDAVRRAPGVERVSLAGGVPPKTGILFGRVHVEGKAPDSESSMFFGMPIDPDYLTVIGQALVAGRNFTRAEMRGETQPIILGETAARKLFPDGDATGRRFGLDGEDPYTVIGIVRDAALSGLTSGNAIPIAYWPLRDIDTNLNLLVRTRSEGESLTRTLHELVQSVEPEAVINVRSARELLELTIARERFTTRLLSTFAALALLLAAIGLYGVLGQVVTSRTHEIGVRVSLGASATSIRLMVLRSGLTAIAAGLVLGGLLVAGGIGLMRSRIFGLTEQRPLAYLAAAAALGICALLAMWQPAERATRVDPMQAMRAE